MRNTSKDAVPHEDLMRLMVSFKQNLIFILFPNPDSHIRKLRRITDVFVTEQSVSIDAKSWSCLTCDKILTANCF